ncbi:hypothetical protein [Pseudorhizobium halotolerans]|jgi:hypothetical protein|uniref:hypothetical protein n=1 Tax=Pseudorhizobium halotolerans TaxID=1233081 RepID=UPI001614539E|nr:hypothetical protein [Pseudorhizobium halotolerans]
MMINFPLPDRTTNPDKCRSSAVAIGGNRFGWAFSGIQEASTKKSALGDRGC